MAKSKGNKKGKGKQTTAHNYYNNNLVVAPCRKRQQKQRIKRVSWRDEQIQGMSVSDIDSAILVVHEIRIRYTREELFKIGEHPASKSKPEFLDVNEVTPTILDPEKWNLERKKSDTPTENGPRVGDISDHRRRPGDPRERIRKENDGIVLSPQRRSFNSGCFVPVRDTARTSRPHSPLGKNETAHIGVREIQSSNRRIGSGRILRDSWDFGDKAESGDNDFTFSRGQQRNNERDDRREDRRSFGREFEPSRDKEKEVRRNGRYSERRRFSETNREDEPEWFSGGPLSQNDTIELRGFDESEKIGQKKKLSPSRVKRAKEWSKKKNESQASIIEEKEKEEPAGRSTPNPSNGSKAEAQQPQKSDGSEQIAGENEIKHGDHSFNFDDILKCDTIPGLLTNGVGGESDNTKSRFSRWFKKESPEKLESRRSSIQEDHHIIKDLLKDIGETSVSIPGDSESYFAPISPAANTGGLLSTKQGGQPINIMEMLQKGKQKNEGANNFKQQSVAGKILNLDELEAKMRQAADVSVNMQQKSQQQKPNEEMTAAFKRLLAQAGAHQGPQNGPKPQAMSLLEMLNHSQQQDEARLASGNAHLLGPASPNLSSIHNPNIVNDLTLKLQQAQLQKQQMDMLNKLINAGIHPPQLRASPLHDMGIQQSRELLNRPEAQAILQAMHQRIPSPRELQVHTQNILQRALIKKKLEEQTENYRKKQEMQRGTSPNATTTQVPSKNHSSPTPLAFTPTSVLRKMTADKDEGKENKSGTSDTSKPAGRAVTGMRPQSQPATAPQQWNQQFSVKQPVGRPIVKANNFQQPAQTQTEQFFNQTQQQHQQQQQQQRLYNQPMQQTQQQQQQQRKPTSIIGQQYSIPNGPPTGVQQYNNAPYSSNQPFSQQLTQQQMRAQHQHRPANQQSLGAQQQSVLGHQNQQHQLPQQLGYHQTSQQQGNLGNAWQQFLSSTQQNSRSGMGRGGLTDGELSPTTTNQLARWFSPDLLERARGGELPSTAGLAQHALSLEEIERQTAPPVHN